MDRTGRRYVYKRATTAREIEQVHRLNHRTFVQEIPQHADPGGGRLVDKFHEKNVYFIALFGERVVGMVSVHDRPPFSAAARLSDPRVLERPGLRFLETRLLAIEPEARRGRVLGGLLAEVLEYAIAGGHTHLLISGLVEREGLYRRLGFKRLGLPVAAGSASFVPMAAEVATLPSRIRRDLLLSRRSRGRTHS